MELFHHGHFWSNFSYIEGPRLHLAFEQRFCRKDLKKTKLPFWLMLYIFEGNAEISIPSIKKRIKPERSHLYLFPPNLKLIDYIPGDMPIHSCYLCCQNGEQANLSEKLQHKKWAEFYDPQGKTGQIIKTAADIGYKYGDTEFWRAQGIFCQLLSMINKAYNTQKNHWIIQNEESSDLKQNIKASLSTRVYKFLHTNINCVISLDDIADELGISTSTLSHNYQNETGITPMKAYIEMRIARIKELLRLGSSVKNIANQMSFNDSSALSKFFKRNVGISPRQFINTDNNL